MSCWHDEIDRSMTESDVVRGAREYLGLWAPCELTPVTLGWRELKMDSAADVFRVKGFVAVAGKPMRLLLQAVGARVTHQYDRPWNAAETRQGHLVVIGLKGLDRAAVTRTLLG